MTVYKLSAQQSVQPRASDYSLGEIIVKASSNGDEYYKHDLIEVILCLANEIEELKRTQHEHGIY